MASLLTGTTIGGNLALHAGNYTNYVDAKQFANFVGTAAGGAWYTIAVNPGDRASALFMINDFSSGCHQSVHFIASHFYSNGDRITVLHNDYYSTSPFRYIRIKKGGTYDGAMLQVYLDNNSDAPEVIITQNEQSSGWIVKNWIADGTNPGNLSNYAAVVTVAVSVDLDLGAPGNLISSGAIAAPIFYDSGDGNFYVNPDTGTVLKNFIDLGIRDSAGTSGRSIRIEGVNDSSGEGSGRIFFTENNSGSSNNYGFSISYNGTGANPVMPSSMTLGGGNAEWAFWGHDNSLNGTKIMFGYRNETNVYITGSLRTPIFYDSNDTNYYCDPASTSSLNLINHYGANAYGGDSASVYSSYNTAASNALQFRVLHSAANVKIFNNRGALFLNDNGNNVGVGTTNPTSSLHVKGAVSAPSDSGIFEIGDAARRGLSFGYDNSTSQGWIYCRDVGVSSRVLNLNVGSLYVLGGSYAYSPYSLRAPVFYDYNDTAYYCDPASTSILNKINLNTAATACIQWRSAGQGTIAGGYPFYNNVSYGSINIEVSDNDTGGLVIDNEGVTVYGAADNGQLFRTIDEDVYQTNGNVIASATTFWINQGQDGGGVIRGTFTSTGDFRAPVFYDSGDTNYYLDPGNTGISLLVAGKVGIGTTTTTYALDVRGDVRIGNGSSTEQDIRFFSLNGDWQVGTNNGGNGTNNNQFYIYDSAYRLTVQNGTGNVGIGAASPDTNLQVVGHVHVGNQTTFENSGGWNKTIYLDGTVHARLRILGSAYASGKNSATETNIWVDNSQSPYSGLSTNAGSFQISAGYTTMLNSARSPIFYDSDDTTYYVNPNSASNLYNLTIGNWTTNQSYPGILILGNIGYNYNFLNGTWTSSITAGIVANCSDEWEFVIHDSGTSVESAFIYQNSTGIILMGRDIGWGTTPIRAASDFRAPIFYDSDDTNYYLNPASTSIVYLTKTTYNTASSLANGTFNVAKTILGGLHFNNGSGTNGAGKEAAITFQGGTADEAQAGIYVHNNSNEGTHMAFATTDSYATGPQIGLRIMNSGYSYFPRSYVEAANSFRAPIFYDSNDTNYYCDPASTSVLSAINHFGINFYGSDSGIVYSSYNTSASNALQFRISHNLGNVKIFNNRGAIYINDNGNNVGIGTTAAATSLQIGGPSPTAATSGIQFGDDTGARIYRGASGVVSFSSNINTGAYISAGSYVYASTYLQTGNNNIYPNGQSNTLNINVGNSANNAWIAGITLAPGGIVTAYGDMRSPIFYDSANTAYYTDPASTSVLNTLNSSTLNGSVIGVNNTTNTNGYGISLYNGAVAGEPTYGLMFQGTATFGTHGSVTGDWATYFTMNNDNTRGWIFRKVGQANVASISGGGTLTVTSDIRSPVFYDSSDIAYYLDPANSTTSAILNGKVGIGTTAPSTSYKLDVNGGIHYTSSTASSDIRFKKNITIIDNALGKLDAIRGVRYEWNEFINSKRDGYKLNEPTLGVIAQEVETVFPELVTTWDLSEDCHDAKGVNYEKFVPVLIQAVKELKAKNESLEARILILEEKFK